MKLHLCLSVLFIVNCLHLFNSLNFTPSFPTNATNFEIVEITAKNQIGVYFSIALENQQIRVYNAGNQSLSNTLLLSTYPNMKFLTNVPNTEYISFIDVQTSQENKNQELVVLDAENGLKKYIVTFNSSINIEHQININSTTFAITYFDNIMHLQIYYFGYDRVIKQITDKNISDIYSIIANETHLIYICKDYYSRTINLKVWNYDSQQISTIYSDKSLLSFQYLDKMTLFQINQQLIGLNLMNSTVLLFNVSQSTIQPNSINLNFTSFGYCIPYQGYNYPSIACFGVRQNQNILFVYAIASSVVTDSLIEPETIYQINIGINNTIVYATSSYLKEWNFMSKNQFI